MKCSTKAGLWLGNLSLTGACAAAAGPIGNAPSAGRRGLLVLLECMAPYLAERVSQSADAELGPGGGRVPTWAAPAHSMGGALDDLDMEAPASLSGSCSVASSLHWPPAEGLLFTREILLHRESPDALSMGGCLAGPLQPFWGSDLLPCWFHTSCLCLVHADVWAGRHLLPDLAGSSASTNVGSQSPSVTL